LARIAQRVDDFDDRPEWDTLVGLQGDAAAGIALVDAAQFCRQSLEGDRLPIKLHRLFVFHLENKRLLFRFGGRRGFRFGQCDL
jgi:hypothetical protein